MLHSFRMNGTIADISRRDKHIHDHPILVVTSLSAFVSSRGSSQGNFCLPTLLMSVPMPETMYKKRLLSRMSLLSTSSVSTKRRLRKVYSSKITKITSNLKPKKSSKTDPKSGYMHRPGKPNGFHYLSHTKLKSTRRSSSLKKCFSGIRDSIVTQRSFCFAPFARSIITVTSFVFYYTIRL